MRSAVVTVAAGRHKHLRRQHLALAAIAPQICVVVAMGDRATSTVAEEGPLGTHHAESVLSVVQMPADPSNLPLARARNLGAARAVRCGAELLIFLDVDCIPGPDLVNAYERAARTTALRAAPRLLCGSVTYLPPMPTGTDYPFDLSGMASPHPDRPAPSPRMVVETTDFRLFWSLSFAMTAKDWIRSGGFDEAYTGYGAEDTDFGQTVAALGGRMFWVGGADAYHQWHRVSDPPVEHLESIVRNANLFSAKWGWAPMQGWLRVFERAGLARTDTGTTWHVTEH